MTGKKRRVVLFIFIAGLAGIFAFSFWERSRGKRSLEEVRERLRHAKVDLDLQKYNVNTVPEQENAAPELLKIADELREFELPTDLSPAPAMSMRKGGRAASFVREAGWPGSGGTLHTWEELRSVQRETLKWFTELKRIASLPRFATPFDVSKGGADIELKPLGAFPAAMRVLRTSALLDLHFGEDEQSAEAVITLLNLYCTKSEDVFLISEMVRRSQARLAFSLTWELFHHADLRDETWERMQSAWEQCSFLGIYERIARAEIAFMNDYFERTKASAAYRRRMLDNFSTIEEQVAADWNAPVRGFLLYRVHAPVWRALWADQDHAKSLRENETELRLATAGKTGSWEEIQDEAARLGRALVHLNLDSSAREMPSFYDRCRYLFSYPPTLFERSHILSTFQAETERRMAAVAIALLRYRIANGIYPENLRELSPRFIGAIPTDPMDGELIKYRRKTATTFLLYSAGVNANDDQGAASTDDESKTPTFWNGPDAIWPELGRTSTPEE